MCYIPVRRNQHVVGPCTVVSRLQSDEDKTAGLWRSGNQERYFRNLDEVMLVQ